MWPPLWASIIWLLAVFTMLIFIGLLWAQRVACPYVDIDNGTCDLVYPGYCDIEGLKWLNKESCPAYRKQARIEEEEID